ncbi:MAG: hypothetical protein JSV34_04810 [Candidatus Omnitrophota bacterium]|nr:MAG: hypothetical protein JSV34_04810 [Candidatus Omnitrophota bacterium]
MDRKTAVVVIHGIGQQESFEALDAFTRNFSKTYSELCRDSKQSAFLQKRHSLRRFPDWIESYVSLNPGSADKGAIDIYEYYWAHLTQRKISACAVMQWLIKVSGGAREFYKRQKSHMANKPKNDRLFRKDGEFKNYEYLVWLLSFGNWIRYIFLVLASLFKIKRLGFLDIIKNIAMKPLESYLGDVTIYSSSDKKSEYFYVRKKILDGALRKVKFLLECEQYGRIILAGHSLGSVIAYDVLDRLNKEMNLDSNLRKLSSKIEGLVTFGSPLDKVAFFFDEHISKKKQSIRYALVSQLHSFKRVNVDTTTVENSIEQYFEGTRWINFWAKTDPVSGHLDVYRGVENVEMDFSPRVRGFSFFGSKKYLLSHLLYWDDERMYKRIIEEFELVKKEVAE